MSDDSIDKATSALAGVARGCVKDMMKLMRTIKQARDLIEKWHREAATLDDLVQQYRGRADEMSAQQFMAAARELRYRIEELERALEGKADDQ